jgi:hypothetical protein
MADNAVLMELPEECVAQIVGVFSGPWDTGWPSRDGAVLGFEDLFRAFCTAAKAGEMELVTVEIDIFRDYRRIRDFLAACDSVYANCGPWAALLYLVRERERLDVSIIREVRTVGWVGYIWQEEIAGPLARPGDQRVFPSHYARDIWDAATPGVSESRVYYPIIRNTPMSTGPDSRSGGTVGFFSVLSRDKGFACLPGVIARMISCGHLIDHLVLAGERADPPLYISVVNELSDIGVEVSFRGGLPNLEVRELMGQCDCVFFLSVSSIESLGRVMIEASEQGVPVVTADFGAARDLVRADYRVPVKYLPSASGPCDTAFPLGQLDLTHWKPPAILSSEACFLNSVSEYRDDRQTATDILSAQDAEPSAEPRPVAFSFSSAVDGLQLAQELLDDATLLQDAPSHELLDLGGTLKKYLLSRGYNPRVSFRPEILIST